VGFLSFKKAKQACSFIRQSALFGGYCLVHLLNIML
jgi:hypothetical protein